ncbi:MAG: dTDP-4-amino-4,6-dideoxygalactose transaminase [Flavobacteriaceae bacterium]|jgi:dTDP-4-amino-4,6-dideoxygalactose transaminase
MPLHRSAYIQKNTDQQQTLTNAANFSENLVRLPLFMELQPE